MNPYSCTGTSIPTMFGRKKIFTKICEILSRTTPHHVSVIGPKLYGKTVLLSHLTKHLRSNEGVFASVYIDLRHHTPQSDTEFRRVLADRLIDTFQSLNREYSDTLRESDDETIPDIINYILGELSESKKRLVIIFDAFENLPLGISISPNLLDQLRSFATDNTSLCMVIGSRLRLRELCKTEESRTSDFWRIFVEPVQVGAFEDSDFDLILQPFEDRKITFEQGAKTELKAQTGGVPLFVAGILKDLYEGCSDNSRVTQADIVAAARADRCDAVNDLWQDCEQELRNLLVNAAAGEATADSYSTTLIDQAAQRGFAQKEGSKIKISCRIIGEHAKSQATKVHDMNRLFAKREDFESNAKRLLELRLAQTTKEFLQLINTVKITINNMDDGPAIVLNNARMIRDDALKVICSKEGLTPGGALPTGWHETLLEQANDRDKDRLTNIFPTDCGNQIRVLSWLSGCDSRYKNKLTKTISRQSFYILRNIHEFGGFLNHRNGEEPSVGTAILLCLTAIELLDSLARDSGNDT